MFGSTTSTSFGTSSTAPATAPIPQQQQKQQETNFISYYSNYSTLPKNAQNAIDELYNLAYSHQKQMAQIEGVSPLFPTEVSTVSRYHISDEKKSNGEEGAEAHNDVIQGYQAATYQLSQLTEQLRLLQNDAKFLQSQAQLAAESALKNGAWPIEALAIRKGIISSEHQQQQSSSFDIKKGYERLERIPSEFFLNLVTSFDSRKQQIDRDVDRIREQLRIVCSQQQQPAQQQSAAAEVAEVIQKQYDALMIVGHQVSLVDSKVDRLKSEYMQLHRLAQDPFRMADIQELEERKKIEARIRASVAHQRGTQPSGAATVGAPATFTGGLFGSSSAPAPSGSGLFGSTTTSAPASGGLFGAPVSAAGGLFGTSAPAPASGGLFGSTPAPAPATGGLFGSNPAPAPATGGLFGSNPAPAPATGGLFGSNPAPAPATGGLFGSNSAPAPATGGLFGSTPAPATTGGLFGSTAPAPAPTGGFGSTAAPVSTTGLFGSAASSSSAQARSKSRSKSRGRR